MPPADSSQRARWTRPGPVTAAILIMTALGLALRLYQLSRPDYLIGVTEYDDGTDFGSAILLIHGDLPYRDFIMVQPPGITLLMAPVALVTKGFGTAWGMGVGRILTALAGAAAVAMGGLLVRHRGLLAVIVTGGILAVYPAAVQAAHTVLLEPWLVLFCLAGMLAVFDGDGLASTRRLVWGGVAFGFAGAIKVWAILPVLVIVVLILAARQPRRALAYAAGVVAGFAVPVLPFAALAPGTFYRSVIVAQLVRVDSVRIPLGYRLHEMTGLTDVTGLTSTLALSLISLLILALVVGCSVAASRLAGERPPLLEQFALAASALTIIAFLWPADFYYHYAGFLAPFLALAIALPVARFVDALRETAGRGPRRCGGRPAPPGGQAGRPLRDAGRHRGRRRHGRRPVRFESSLQPPLAPTTPGLTSDVVSAASDVIPPGCVRPDRPGFLRHRRQPVRVLAARLRAHGGRRGQRLLAVPGPERGHRRAARARGPRAVDVGAARRPVRLAVAAVLQADPVGRPGDLGLLRPELRARPARPVRPVHAQGPAPPLIPADMMGVRFAPQAGRASG